MSKENPWKTISTKVVYENEWIRVREDEVIRPDGNQGIYGVVETRIATATIALSKNNEIYLVGQYRYPLDVYSWEVIEGGSNDGESALDAAKRELKEETGLTANNWLQLGPEIHLTNCHSSETGFAFLATDLQAGPASPDGTELLQIEKIQVDKVFEMVDSGEISDAISIIALERLRKQLEK